MNFNNNEVRKVINHVSTRSWSLEKCLEKILMQCRDFEKGEGGGGARSMLATMVGGWRKF